MSGVHAAGRFRRLLKVPGIIVGGLFLRSRLLLQKGRVLARKWSLIVLQSVFRCVLTVTGQEQRCVPGMATPRTFIFYLAVLMSIRLHVNYATAEWRGRLSTCECQAGLVSVQTNISSMAEAGDSSVDYWPFLQLPAAYDSYPIC